MSRGRLSLAIAAALVATATAGATEPPLATVGSVDVARYAGLWYEIANYPNRFQKVCVRNTTADSTSCGTTATCASSTAAIPPTARRTLTGWRAESAAAPISCS